MDTLIIGTAVPGLDAASSRQLRQLVLDRPLSVPFDEQA
jgi:hypothetical protein